MNLNKYLTVVTSLVNNSGIIMHRRKSSKLVEQTSQSSSNQGSLHKSNSIDLFSTSTMNLFSQSPSVTHLSPLISAPAIFVRNPHISALNPEWYNRNDKHCNSYSMRPLIRPPSSNLYESAIADDEYLSYITDPKGTCK